MLNFRTANLILIVAISEIRSCFGLALGDSKEFCNGNELLSEIQSVLHNLDGLKSCFLKLSEELEWRNNDI